MSFYIINSISPIDGWYKQRHLFEGKVMQYYPGEDYVGKFRFVNKPDIEFALKHFADNKVGFVFIAPNITQL